MNMKLITLNFKRHTLYLGTQPCHEGWVWTHMLLYNPGSKRKHVGNRAWPRISVTLWKMKSVGLLMTQVHADFKEDIGLLRRVISSLVLARLQTEMCVVL